MRHVPFGDEHYGHLYRVEAFRLFWKHMLDPSSLINNSLIRASRALQDGRQSSEDFGLTNCTFTQNHQWLLEYNGWSRVAFGISRFRSLWRAYISLVGCLPSAIASNTPVKSNARSNLPACLTLGIDTDEPPPNVKLYIMGLAQFPLRPCLASKKQ